MKTKITVEFEIEHGNDEREDGHINELLSERNLVGMMGIHLLWEDDNSYDVSNIKAKILK